MLVRLMKRVGASYGAVQPTDQIACDLSQATITPIGGANAPLAGLVGQLDAYLYRKAINANATTSGAGGVDAMLSFTQANNGPGSNAVAAATTNVPAPAGGDFEALVVTPWLTGSTSATPSGAGLSSAAAASLIATLRAAAVLLTH